MTLLDPVKHGPDARLNADILRVDMVPERDMVFKVGMVFEVAVRRDCFGGGRVSKALSRASRHCAKKWLRLYIKGPGSLKELQLQYGGQR